MLDVRRIGICEEDHGGSWMIMDDVRSDTQLQPLCGPS